MEYFKSRSKPVKVIFAVVAIIWFAFVLLFICSSWMYHTQSETAQKLISENIKKCVDADFKILDIDIVNHSPVFSCRCSADAENQWTSCVPRAENKTSFSIDISRLSIYEMRTLNLSSR